MKRIAALPTLLLALGLPAAGCANLPGTGTSVDLAGGVAADLGGVIPPADLGSARLDLAAAAPDDLGAATADLAASSDAAATDGGCGCDAGCDDTGRCLVCGRDSDCPAGALCHGGTCTPGCTTSHPCAAGLSCCGAGCVDTTIDPANCGACGQVCAGGLTCCAGACVDLVADPHHCGTCATVCTSPGGISSCGGGACGLAACNAGRADCNGDPADGCEIDTLGDTGNCGACAHACSRGHGTPTCDAASCHIACDAGWGDCDSSATNGCETDLGSSVDDCGACGNACPTAGGVASCAGGACALQCAPGYADCNGDPRDGCEAGLYTDANHCGACGQRCAAPWATDACVGGLCAVAACAPDRADCNGDPGDGCEADTTADPAHCGSCAQACSDAHGAPTCAASRCAPACDAGWADCDHDPAASCETDLTSTTDSCGACGLACALDHAASACVAGQCRVASCVGGFLDCDGDPSNGCEVDPQNDPLACGACGLACGTDHATASCAQGACALRCDAGYGDCNGDARDGCEVDLTASPEHCGGCALACQAPGGTPACVAGQCAVAACAPGRADCNGLASDGCEVDLGSSLDSCGACGAGCGGANGKPGCTSGRCTIACSPGYGDCDGDPRNGCEVDLTANAGNCGSCGAACALPHSVGDCAGGGCAVSRCVPGWADCNSLPADGCETSLGDDAKNCGACGVACAQRCLAGACVQPRTWTVNVGPGALSFAPSALTISAGDTVSWVWLSNGHNVVSGPNGRADGRFCSPDDRNCAAAPTSNSGAMYSHTFLAPGTYPYYCAPHYLAGMTGSITVQ